MGEGDTKELRELIAFLKANGIAEFDMERPDLKVRLKFSCEPPAVSAAPAAGLDLVSLARLMNAGAGAAAPGSASSAESEVAQTSSSILPGATVNEVSAAAVDSNAGLHLVRSPLVGTFYDASSPGAEPFIKVGDRVENGKVLCIVEAMKIMNEIESDAAGEVVKIFVRPGQPVEYGQQLFGIRA